MGVLVVVSTILIVSILYKYRKLQFDNKMYSLISEGGISISPSSNPSLRRHEESEIKKIKDTHSDEINFAASKKFI